MRPVERWAAIIALAVPAILASNGAAAANCKFQQDETDKFTKVRTLWTRSDGLEALFGASNETADGDLISFVSAYSRDGDMNLMLKISLSSYHKRRPLSQELKGVMDIPAGSRLLIMMADETIVTLFSASGIKKDAYLISPSAPGNITDTYIKEYGATIRYALDAETSEALTSQDATNVRVEAADTRYDIKIHKKSSGDIKKVIKCLQAEL